MTPSQRSFAILALVVLATGAPAASAPPARVGVVASVRGEAMLSRASLPEPTPLRRRDDVFVADRITTGDQSFTRLLLGGKALVTVRERSTLTITEGSGASVVDVASGAVALAVVKERMSPGERVEIRTPNAVAGIRGTVVIAEVGGTAAGGVTTTITVLRGLVEVRPLDGATRQPGGPLVELGASQWVQFVTHPAAASAIPTPVQPVTPELRRRLSEQWKVGPDDQPRGAPAAVVESQKEEAAALVKGLVEGAGGWTAIGPATTLGPTTTLVGSSGTTLSGGTSPSTSTPTGGSSGSSLLSGSTLSSTTTTLTESAGLLSGTTSTLTGASSGLGGTLNRLLPGK